MESSGCAREPRCFRRSEKGQRVLVTCIGKFSVYALN